MKSLKKSVRRHSENKIWSAYLIESSSLTLFCILSILLRITHFLEDVYLMFQWLLGMQLFSWYFIDCCLYRRHCHWQRHLSDWTVNQNSSVLLWHPSSACRSIVSGRLFHEAGNFKNSSSYIGTLSVTFFCIILNIWQMLLWNRNPEEWSHF